MNVRSNSRVLEGRTYGAGVLTARAPVAAQALPEWLGALKSSALGTFEAAGFPSPRDEAWRFTDISDIVSGPFVPQEVARSPVSSGALAAARRLLAERLQDLDETARLVFVDGAFQAALSRFSPKRDDVVACSIDQALSRHPQRVRAALGSDPHDGFQALNTVLFQSGAFVHLAGPRPAEGAGRPVIHLVHVATERAVPLAFHPRTLVVADPGTSSLVIETYLGADGARYLVNGLSQVTVGAGAHVAHVVLQEESRAGYHLQALEIRLDAGARFSSHSVALGGHRSRLDIAATLEQDGAEVALQGVYVARGRRQMDHHTVVTHVGRHTSSRQVYRGVLDDRATAVFDGMIHVAPGAQKTDARQSVRNLLLSGDAVVHAQPRLEINADDVQCAHGATIGQLDPEALFYLQSRGVGQEEARRLLVQGFAGESIQTLPHPPLRRLVEHRIRSLLEAHEGETS